MEWFFLWKPYDVKELKALIVDLYGPNTNYPLKASCPADVGTLECLRCSRLHQGKHAPCSGGWVEIQDWYWWKVFQGNIFPSVGDLVRLGQCKEISVHNNWVWVVFFFPFHTEPKLSQNHMSTTSFCGRWIIFSFTQLRCHLSKKKIAIESSKSPEKKVSF